MENQVPIPARAKEYRMVSLLEEGMQWLFGYRPGRAAALFRIAWLVGLYLAGVYLWGVFFSWGNLSFDFLDWAEVTGPRYAILQDAARTSQLPLHAANPAGLRGVTDRYLAIADTPFSPQFWLLRFLEMGQFVFLNTILDYTVGYVGLILLYRRYHLSVGVFTLLFLLLNFNGNLTTHLAVGHSNWVGQFLLPYFILLVLDLLGRATAGWRWILGVVVVLVTVLLQGHFHLYVWCLLFLALLVVFAPRHWKVLLLAAVATVLVSLPRLLPPALILRDITHEYLGGFASLSDLLSSLILLRDPDRASALPSLIFPLNGWELDHYIGLLGALGVAYFGVYRPLKNRDQHDGRVLPVLLACLVLAALSIGDLYATLVRFVPVPPLTGERVTSRILILPLAFLLVLSAIYLQHFLDQMLAQRARGRLELWEGFGFIILSAILFHDLNRHLQAWRIRYLDGLTYLYPKVPFDPAQHILANHADPVYTGLLLGGLAAAVAALGFLIWMAVREQKKER